MHDVARVGARVVGEFIAGFAQVCSLEFSLWHEHCEADASHNFAVLPHTW